MNSISFTDLVPTTHEFSRLTVVDIEDTPYEKSTIDRNIVGGLIAYTYGKKKEHRVQLDNLSETEKAVLKAYCSLQTTLTFKIFDDSDDSEIESYTCIISSTSFKTSQRNGVVSCALKVQEI